MKFIKHILLVVLIGIGSSTVQQTVYADAATATSWFSLKSFENFKFEVQPSSFFDLIREYPVTSVGVSILATIGIMKLYNYWTEDIPDYAGEVYQAIEQELHPININDKPKYNFLLNETICCGPFEFLYFRKSKVSLAELAGGQNLIKLIKAFYFAKDNWQKDSPNSIDNPSNVKDQIREYLFGKKRVPVLRKRTV